MPSYMHEAPVSDFPLTLMNGQTVEVVDGLLNVDVSWQSAEPDVGIMSDWPEEIWPAGGWIECSQLGDLDDTPFRIELREGDPLLARILESQHDAIAERLEAPEPDFRSYYDD